MQEESTSKRLEITLYVNTAYVTASGIGFLFLPDFVESVMPATLPDKALNTFCGQMMFTFASVVSLAARGGAQLFKLSLVMLALAAHHVVIFGYQLTTG